MRVAKSFLAVCYISGGKILTFLMGQKKLPKY
jgi:hypothetical protein